MLQRHPFLLTTHNPHFPPIHLLEQLVFPYKVTGAGCEATPASPSPSRNPLPLKHHPRGTRQPDRLLAKERVPWLCDKETLLTGALRRNFCAVTDSCNNTQTSPVVCLSACSKAHCTYAHSLCIMVGRRRGRSWIIIMSKKIADVSVSDSEQRILDSASGPTSLAALYITCRRQLPKSTDLAFAVSQSYTFRPNF